jgi:hypothetical protein
MFHASTTGTWTQADPLHVLQGARPMCPHLLEPWPAPIAASTQPRGCPWVNRSRWPAHATAAGSLQRSQLARMHVHAMCCHMWGMATYTDSTMRRHMRGHMHVALRRSTRAVLAHCCASALPGASPVIPAVSPTVEHTGAAPPPPPTPGALHSSHTACLAAGHLLAATAAPPSPPCHLPPHPPCPLHDHPAAPVQAPALPLSPGQCPTTCPTGPPAAKPGTPRHALRSGH